MLIKPPPKVSVCIPVYDTEKYLFRCLESVALQNFAETEIIVVDDDSPSTEAFGSASEIVKRFKKNCKKQKIIVKFIKNKENKGLVETRRIALYEASGKYVMFLDSDDTLPGDAIKSLFEAAEKTGADIVQGKANVCIKANVEGRCGDSSPLEGVAENAKRLERGEGFPPQIKKRIDEMNKKANNVFIGALEGREIFDGFLLECNHSGFLWGKIFTRELCLKVAEKIPPVYCCVGEDFLVYFFLSYFAQNYAGIEKIIYNYNVDIGISSFKMIDSLEKWEKVCSTAGVFTILLGWIQENADKITEKEAEKMREICRNYAANNLAQLKKAVAPELQENAHKMLCDFWGENMIKNLEITG